MIGGDAIGGFRLRSPGTVLFGRGCIERLPALAADLGIGRPLLVTDPGVAATGLPERIAGSLEAAGGDASIWAECFPDPDDELTDRCRDRLVAGGHDGVIAIGGGSVLDPGKVAAALVAVSARTAECFGFDRIPRAGLPMIAVPTTAGGGAEVSSHAVISAHDSGKKEVVAGLHILPRAAVVDPDTTCSLPPRRTLETALDGLVHAIEAYVARGRSAVTDLFALEAVPRILRALPRALDAPEAPEPRLELSLGGLYSGLAMANANAGAIHAVGYPLTGRFGVPHGLANGMVAPTVLERLWPSSPERYAEIARRFGAPHDLPDEEAAAALPGLFRAFLERCGVTSHLPEHGVTEAELPDLARAASLFRPVLENTPVRLDVDDLEEIYRCLWHATAPEVG